MGAGVGALSQIAAVGPQNHHITLDPECNNFFSAVFHRHVPFAIEQREIRYDRDLRFGEKIRLRVPADADFLGDLYVELVLPFISGRDGEGAYWWCDMVGHALIKKVRLSIDDVVVHEYDKYVHGILEAAWTSPERRWGKRQMVGVNLRSNAEHTLYVPLSFFHARPREGQGWLPLWAMRNSTIAVEIELEDIFNLVLVEGDPFLDFYKVGDQVVHTISQKTTMARIRHVYKKTSPHEATYEVELLDSGRRIVASQDVLSPLYKPTSSDQFFLKEVVEDAVPPFSLQPLRIVHGNFALLMHAAFVDNEARFFHRDDLRLIEQLQIAGETANASESNVDVEVAVDKFFVDLPFINNVKYVMWTVQRAEDVEKKNNYFAFLDAMESGSLHFDGDQTDVRKGSFYKTLQPYHASLKTDDINNVYVFSFALEASSYQPSGVAFMSGFKSKKLRMELDPAFFQQSQRFIVRAYAASYNVLEASGGRGRLKFTT